LYLCNKEKKKVIRKNNFNRKEKDSKTEFPLLGYNINNYCVTSSYDKSTDLLSSSLIENTYFHFFYFAHDNSRNTNPTPSLRGADDIKIKNKLLESNPSFKAEIYFRGGYYDYTDKK
jgi:hypothetical protein